MEIFEAFLLGALQGVTEFIPISSSGHLLLFENLLGYQDVPVLFDVLLHVATLLVVIVVFRDRIIKIFLSLWRLIKRQENQDDIENINLVKAIIVATLCTGILGFIISTLDLRSNIGYIYILLIFTGVVLLLSRFLKGEKSYNDINWKVGLIAGFAQGLGVFPGVSRSGITIVGSRIGGLSREKAGEFSFLISIPAIIGALFLELRDVETLQNVVGFESIVVGFLSALVIGFVSLQLLLRIIKQGRLYLFSVYLIPFGIIGTILWS